jgi:glycosyltransferase involved in cell wall biosynthesis
LRIAITADPELPVPPTYYGGIERIIALLIDVFTEMGHEVVLFAHRDSVVPCKLIPYPSAGNDAKSIFVNATAVNRRLFTQKFDIIHSFGRLGYLLPQMPLSIVKLMSYQREPTLTQIRKAVRLSVKGSISFTGCSDYISNKIKPFGPSRTIYNCVDMDKYHLVSSVGRDAPLVFLGRIEPIKGTHNAIEIAIKTQKKLIIAGNVPNDQMDYFKNKILPFINEQITYIGPVNDTEKNALLGHALALLMPIEWDEPFGIVMIEAMACGTPILALNRGAVPEIVENGITGFYTEDTDALIGKVGQIENLSRTEIRAITLDRFSKQAIANQYIGLYKELIG